ncbi:hypothetical protein CEQ90_11775 [Lewinellaceae bacterium SD302]|nr:hypothetical protein CEQ90_11775 [Lewinellaceae bacterium SD302]
MKNFHWGHGIALFYTTFALTMIFAVIKSTSFDNSLVTKDYYAQDIAYQQTMDRLSHSRELVRGVRVDKREDQYVLVFPIQDVGDDITGKVQLYSPVSSDRDLNWDLMAGEDGEQRIPLEKIPNGRYQLIVKWTDGKLQYQDEFPLYLQN